MGVRARGSPRSDPKMGPKGVPKGPIWGWGAILGSFWTPLPPTHGFRPFWGPFWGSILGVVLGPFWAVLCCHCVGPGSGGLPEWGPFWTQNRGHFRPQKYRFSLVEGTPKSEKTVISVPPAKPHPYPKIPSQKGSRVLARNP